MKRLIISLPDGLYSQLEALASEVHISEAGKEYHVSMAEITRRALYDYLNSPSHNDSALPGYIEGIAGKSAQHGGKIAGHGGNREGAGRKVKK